MDTHVIYATSVSDTHLFPNNIPASFQNRLFNQLELDPRRSYEMCLQKLLLPTSHYVIKRDNPEAYIRVGVTYEKVSEGKYMHSKHLLSSDVLAGTIKEINTTINTEIEAIFSSNAKLSFLGKSLKQFSAKYGTHFIKYDSSSNRNKFTTVISDENISSATGHKNISRVTLSFGTAFGKVLGVVPEIEYDIFAKRQYASSVVNTCLFPPMPRGGVDILCVYCDRISSTRYGNQSVNILDVISLNGSDNSNNKKLYVRLNTNMIDSVSITIRDQDGNPIHFDERGCTIAVLHVRPVAGGI